MGRGEHDSYEDYRYWKSRLFCQCRTAVMNIDDAECSFMVETFAGSCRDSAAIVFYGRDKKADFRIDNIDLWSERGSLGVKYTLSEACGLSKTCALSEAHALNKADTLGNVTQNGLNAGHFEVFTALPGDFNAYNSAAAIAAVSLLGVPVSTALDTLRNIRIPGRAETVPVSEDFTVMVDYAHNGIALMSLLENLKKYHHNRLITVFGCGGDRDRNRRKEMAEAAAKLSDVIIVTSDNPRTKNR
ncbi:MAG: glutamate ligase domain-containing protein [Anaerovoracaceae bacterium]